MSAIGSSLSPYYNEQFARPGTTAATYQLLLCSSELCENICKEAQSRSTEAKSAQAFSSLTLSHVRERIYSLLIF